MGVRQQSHEQTSVSVNRADFLSSLRAKVQVEGPRVTSSAVKSAVSGQCLRQKVASTAFVGYMLSMYPRVIRTRV